MFKIKDVVSYFIKILNLNIKKYSVIFIWKNVRIFSNTFFQQKNTVFDSVVGLDLTN